MQNILQNPKAFGTPLLIYLVDELGSDVFDLEPESVADFMYNRNPKVSKALINRANAAIGLVTSNLFWQDPITFGMICRTLNRNAYPGAQEPDIDDIAWGMTEAALIADDAGDPKGSNKYSDSIISYIDYMLKTNGIYDTPQSMSGVPSPSFTRTVDDSTQLQSIQERSDDERAAVDGDVGTKMAELLTQIATSGVKLAAEAKKELQQLLRGE